MNCFCLLQHILLSFETLFLAYIVKKTRWKCTKMEPHIIRCNCIIIMRMYNVLETALLWSTITIYYWLVHFFDIRFRFFFLLFNFSILVSHIHKVAEPHHFDFSSLVFRNALLGVSWYDEKKNLLTSADCYYTQHSAQGMVVTSSFQYVYWH